MSTWSIEVAATLDRPIPAEQAQQLAVLIGGGHLAAARYQENRFGVAVYLDVDDPFAALVDLRDGFVDGLAQAGYSVAAWEAAEVLSPAEVERRTAAAGMPELVSTAQVAELLGVTTKRVEQVEGERKRAVAEGRAHAFPAPLVPGWWVRAGIERYAVTRPGPGRPRREEQA